MSAPEALQVPLRHALAGTLILAGLGLQVLRLVGFPMALSAVSLTFWLATLLLWRDLRRGNRRQATVLAGLGFGLLLAAALVFEAEIAWAQLLDNNIYVVAMLVGMSFVGLMGTSRGHAPSPGSAITGMRGTASTWLGVHFLGAILNLSAMFMVGDRLRRHGELSLPQLLALNRGLSSAALWSPFFASMGVVMTLAPAMEYHHILLLGLPLGLAAGSVSLLELSRRFDLDAVPGFSLSPRSLLMPMGIAALALTLHYGLTPQISIIGIITIVMPGVALASNLLHGPRWTLRRVRSHALERLPSMRGELSLFLCAGLLTLGLSTFIDAVTGGQWRLFDHFGAPAAVMSFLVIVASSIAGLHPVIGVSVLASMLELTGSRQTLFAFVALAAWAVGTSVGPLSGINLSLQGCYGIGGSRMMRQNLGYAGAMVVLVVVAIGILDTLL